MGCVSIPLLMKSLLVVLPQLVLTSQYQQIMFLEVGQHHIQIWCKVYIYCILIGNITFNYTHLFYSIDQTNTFVSVVFDLITNSIVCNFHNQIGGSKRFCNIDYGPEGESCSSYSQTSRSTSDVVRIGLPLQLTSTGQYCFSLTGNNGTYAAVVEGIFKPNVTQSQAQGNVYAPNDCLYK